MIAVKTLIFTLFLPVVFIVLVPYFLVFSFKGWFAVDIGSLRYIGLIPMVFGVFMYIRCVWSFASLGKGTPAPFDPPKKLVVQGPYASTRNPMYVGVLSLVIGEAILFSSSVLFFYVVLMFLCFHLFVVIYEEPALRERFGDSYRNYCKSIPRWIPRKKKQESQSKE
jgi:protein-S-isoprenylcysteine O-methyltransferase Ste14